jgi:hypothetical protein
MSKLIYLASPYSKYPGGRNAAFLAACDKAAELMLQGHLIFCPIAHSHPIENIGMDGEIKDGDFWLKQDFAVLSKCDELWVYQMPGWDTSYGVGKEIEFAKKNNIEVKYLEYEFDRSSTEITAD